MTPEHERDDVESKSFVRVREIAVVKAIVARPAARAAACTPIRFQSSSRAMTAPTHVPAATPRVSGVVRGLEKSDWKRGAGQPTDPRRSGRHDDARCPQVKHDGVDARGHRRTSQNRARSAATTSSRDTEKRPITAGGAGDDEGDQRGDHSTTRSRPFLVSTDVMMSSPRRVAGRMAHKGPRPVDREDEAGARYQTRSPG